MIKRAKDLAIGDRIITLGCRVTGILRLTTYRTQFGVRTVYSFRTDSQSGIFTANGDMRVEVAK